MPRSTTESAASTRSSRRSTPKSATTTPSGSLTRAKESAWLGALLARRARALQANPTWREAVDRVAVYEAMRRAGNFDLSAPIRTNRKARVLFPAVAGLADSGFPDCTISARGVVSGEPDCTNPSPQEE